MNCYKFTPIPSNPEMAWYENISSLQPTIYPVHEGIEDIFVFGPVLTESYPAYRVIRHGLDDRTPDVASTSPRVSSLNIHFVRFPWQGDKVSCVIVDLPTDAAIHVGLPENPAPRPSDAPEIVDYLKTLVRCFIEGSVEDDSEMADRYSIREITQRMVFGARATWSYTFPENEYNKIFHPERYKPWRIMR